MFFFVLLHFTQLWQINQLPQPVSKYRQSLLILAGIKMQISNVVRTARFWNNLHQVRSKSKNWKVKQNKMLGSNKTKGPKQDSENRLLSPMSQLTQGKYCLLQIIFLRMQFTLNDIPYIYDLHIIVNDNHENNSIHSLKYKLAN